MFQYISCCCLSEIATSKLTTPQEFQYISCCCLSRRHHRQPLLFLRFNTSHVVVYLYLHVVHFFLILVSIHLMLLFIHICEVIPAKRKSFNTSHVVVYQRGKTRKRALENGFNTSHVVVYRERIAETMGAERFNTSHVVVYRRLKSCLLHKSQSFNTSHVVVYQGLCLSAILVQDSFNTSHVVVYLQGLVPRFLQGTFQYISCCCLSKTTARCL